MSIQSVITIGVTLLFTTRRFVGLWRANSVGWIGSIVGLWIGCWLTRLHILSDFPGGSVVIPFFSALGLGQLGTFGGHYQAQSTRGRRAE